MQIPAVPSSSLTLRPFQARALRYLERPGHLICIAPTGAGKSLIYERLAGRPGRRTLLVTPLVALARQQRERLRLAGVAAVMSGGAEPDTPPEPGWSGAWITSPESLLAPARAARLRTWGPDLLVVDECHCLWEWGTGFRPAFLRLPGLAGEPGVKRSLWLTATLPTDARTELMAELPQESRIDVQGEFALPPRLRLEIRRTSWVDRADALLSWVARERAANAGTGVVFAGTRSGTERVARLLRAAGHAAVIYHAGLSSEERRNAEALLHRPDAPIVVATSAFGLGMDYARLRWAVMMQPPYTLLSLAQAIGRCARDATADAAALVLWDSEDFRTVGEDASPAGPRARAELSKLRDFLCASGCRRRRLAEYFDAAAPGSRPRHLTDPGCGACDFCATDDRYSLPTVNAPAVRAGESA